MRLPAPVARRIAIAAQGLAAPRPADPGMRHLVAADVAIFRDDLACGHGKDAKSFRALRLIEGVKPCVPVRRDGKVRAILGD